MEAKDFTESQLPADVLAWGAALRRQEARTRRHLRRQGLRLGHQPGLGLLAICGATDMVLHQSVTLGEMETWVRCI